MGHNHKRTRVGGRLWRMGLVVGAVGAIAGFSSGSASAQADDPPNATGECQASATIINEDGTEGLVIDPYASSGVYEIPLEGTATYTGQVGDGQDRDIRAFNGEVVIKTPPGLPDIEITDEWVWEGSGPGQSKSGQVEWELPGAIPRGVPVRVEGFHQDDGTRCEGHVYVKLEGGLMDSPIGPAALGGTAVALVGVGFAMVPKRGGVA